jgi:UDP:flavonoid glycosyltransferase YjiC (YdhE family)
MARTLGPDDRAPEVIREAVQQVLADPSYRDNARAFQAKMMALPGPEEMVEMIESLRV